MKDHIKERHKKLHSTFAYSRISMMMMSEPRKLHSIQQLIWMIDEQSASAKLMQFIDIADCSGKKFLLLLKTELLRERMDTRDEI